MSAPNQLEPAAPRPPGSAACPVGLSPTRHTRRELGTGRGLAENRAFVVNHFARPASSPARTLLPAPARRQGGDAGHWLFESGPCSWCKKAVGRVHDDQPTRPIEGQGPQLVQYRGNVGTVTRVGGQGKVLGPVRKYKAPQCFQYQPLQEPFFAAPTYSGATFALSGLARNVRLSIRSQWAERWLKLHWNGWHSIVVPDFIRHGIPTAG